MKAGMLARLTMLEGQVREKIPGYEEFMEQWRGMDALSQSLYCEICSNPMNFRGQPRSYRRFLNEIRKHLYRAGILSGNSCPSLMELAGELEAGGHDQ